MTRTRSQTALTTSKPVDKPSQQSSRIAKKVQPAEPVRNSQDSKSKKSPTLSAVTKVKTTSKQRGSTAKQSSEKPEPKYSELVNLNLVKKFDMNAVLDQTGNSIGDCHLPRATLNIIIKESLPPDVRAQKESMDLICFVANTYIDLLSDVSNNVCYKNNKKNIIPEHTLRALQELHLDDYLPFLLVDDQNQKLTDILKSEKKLPEGLHATVKQINNEDKNPSTRESIVNQMLKRLSESNFNGERRKKKKNGSKLWMQGLTAQEIEEKQSKLFENYGGQNDESEDLYNQDMTSNESPSVHANAQSSMQQMDQNAAYWQEYKDNWINHNRPILDQEYTNWVKSNIEYNIQNNIPDGITDEQLFMDTFTAASFYETQYDHFIQAQYGAQQQPETYVQESEVQQQDEQQIVQNVEAQPDAIIDQQVPQEQINTDQVVCENQPPPTVQIDSQQNQEANAPVQEEIKSMPLTNSQKKTPAKEEPKDDINFDEMDQ